MIELNLLPDVKLDYLKAERARRLVLSVSILVAGAAIAILVLLLFVDLAQKKHLSDLNRDITNESQTLEQKPDISKILTVQNQLESLTDLHSSKPNASNLFNAYLDELTPAAAAINSFHIDFTQQAATITGTSDSLATVNKYVDTLKFTTYTDDSVSNPTKAFSNVVLTSFGLNGQAQDPSQAASYTIDLSYDPAIFDITQSAKLAVPNLVTTRSELEQPGDLFRAAPPSAAKTSSTTGGR